MEDFEMSEEERLLRNEVANEVYGDESDGSYGEEATGEEKPLETPSLPEKSEGSAEPKQEEDPWSGVNPALRAALERLEERTSKIDNLDFRVKQAESRVGGIDNRLRDIVIPAEKKQTPEEEEKELMNDEEVADFMNDFPTHASAIRKMVARKGSSVNVEEIRKELQTDFDKKLSDAQMGFELKLLRSHHKDHAVVVKEEGFKPWLSTQDKETQALYGSWDALDAIELISKYKDSKKALADKPDILTDRRARLESAAADKRTPSKPMKQKAEADMTEDELRQHIAKQIWSE